MANSDLEAAREKWKHASAANNISGRDDEAAFLVSYEADTASECIAALEAELARANGLLDDALQALLDGGYNVAVVSGRLVVTRAERRQDATL